MTRVPAQPLLQFLYTAFFVSLFWLDPRLLCNPLFQLEEVIFQETGE